VSQTQIQTQISNTIKSIKVPRKVYNIVRSITESSTRPEYLHNQPIKINENTVKFVKYRDLRRYWTIVIQKLESETEKGYRVEVLEVPVTLTTYTTKIEKSEYGIPYCVTNVIELVIDNHRFTSVYELESTYIVADVPYATPICLADLYNRLLHYIDMVR